MMSTQDKVLVRDVMLPIDKFPVISERTILKEALEQMDTFHLGIACLVGNDNQLLGILTDGDIRRKLLSVQKPLSAFFVDDAIRHSIINPATIDSSTTLLNAVNLMSEKQVWDLPVLADNKLVGLLHLHPAIESLLKN